MNSIDLHLSFVCVFQDYNAGLAIVEVELTAANIRDGDRRGFEINTPFKNFWYVWVRPLLPQQRAVDAKMSDI